MMTRTFLTLLGLTAVLNCGPAAQENNPVLTPTNNETPVDVCVEHRQAYDSDGDDCSLFGSDECLPVECPCSGGAMISSRSCFNGTCEGKRACDEVCAGDGGYVCAPGAQPTCEDNTQNGDETGVDCGGSCPACAVTPTCEDNTQNGNETGVDCGGSCRACGMTATPTCDDNIRNGNESGVDCGGSCPACAATPTCEDNKQNGNETGVDCGGSCPNMCASMSECPFPEMIGALSNVVAVDRLAPSGRRLVVMQGDVAVSQGSAKMEILMVNRNDDFPPGTYDIESMARIEEICEVDGCVSLTYTNQGQTFKWSSLQGGSVTIEEVDAFSTSGSLAGAKFPVDSAALANPAFSKLKECENDVTATLSWDATF